MNNTGFDGLRILEFHRFQDDRGVFSKILDQSFFSANQISADLKQVNYSVTNKQGTVRGLHYQRPPHSEYKIITCLHGEVFDVAVDLRKYSKTFLQYFTYHLKASIPKAIVIPSGFAHGFQAQRDPVFGLGGRGVQHITRHSSHNRPAFVHQIEARPLFVVWKQMNFCCNARQINAIQNSTICVIIPFV